MSSLSMMEAELPPGFRFQPTDDELICDYLMKRLSSCEDPSLMIDIVDLNKCEPWDIPETNCVGGKQWYFYSQQDRKYATGIRTNRATASGYWKATGKDKLVVKKGRLIGMRKTLVFHKGRAPKGNKTGWVMHEFRLQVPVGPPKLPPSSSKDQDWVLCRVFNKSKEEGPSKPSSISQATSSHSYNIKTGSSSLPALTDSYTNNHHVYDEQVPCFSNSSYIPHFFNIEEPKSTSLITAPSFGISSLSAGDEHVVEAVLSQITKMEQDYPNCNMKGSSPVRLGEVVGSESYLCDHMDSANIWSNHYY